jgi:nucleotide-binding universal stress UspA family protein
VKTSQYVRQEQAIAAADLGGIRERWMWGLRLLRDADAFSPGSSQLKPGRADELVRALKAAGRKISQREIQYRLRAARVYETDSQIAQISARFENWSSLIAADFPGVDATPGEPMADHRTDAERKRDHARALADVLGEQGSLFPLDDFEPTTTTLKVLAEYAAEMAELTARFARRDEQRRDYLAQLIEAAGGDLSATWQGAHERAFGESVSAGAA